MASVEFQRVNTLLKNCHRREVVMTTSKADEKQGKTFADFLDGLLNQPRKLIFFSVMVFWVGLVIVSIYFLLLWLTKSSGLNPTELQFSALGSVHFESTVNGKKHILIVV